MRIVFITMFERDFGGGSGRVAHEMALHFSAEHEVALICPGDRTALCEDENGLRILEIKSVGERHVRIPSLSKKNVNTLYDFLDGFAPDIVHAHDPASLGLIGQIWAKMHGTPFVFTSHVLPSRAIDFGAGEVFKFLSNPWAESLTRRALTNFFKNCDALIALNEPAAADIARFGYRGRLFMIPNGRNVSRLGTCEITDVTSQVKVLTFVGLVNLRKNQRYLIEVLAHLPSNFVLQIVGETLDPDYGRQLEELIAEKGLKNVVFIGPVPYEEIPGHLEKTHVFVSASRMEVQSLVIVEALASGTPVVGLSNETVDELVDDAVGCRLARDASPEVFARCVSEICNLPAPKYEQLCRNARQRVEHLDWPRVRGMTIDAYRALLNEHVAAEKRGAQVGRIIALVPSQEVREVLEERLAWFERTAQRRQVSGTTWLWVGLARVLSSVITFVFGPVMRLWAKKLKTEG